MPWHLSSGEHCARAGPAPKIQYNGFTDSAAAVERCRSRRNGSFVIWYVTPSRSPRRSLHSAARRSWIARSFACRYGVAVTRLGTAPMPTNARNVSMGTSAALTIRATTSSGRSMLYAALKGAQNTRTGLQFLGAFTLYSILALACPIGGLDDALDGED